MQAFQNHAAISISDGKLQIVELVLSENKFVIDNIDEEYFDEFLNFNDKEPKIVSLLQSAFSELIFRKKLVSENISFVLAGSLFQIAKLPYDNNLSNKELNNHLKWELGILFPQLLNIDLVVQNFKLSENECFAVALQRRHINFIKTFCSRNSLKLKYIDNDHFAFNRLAIKFLALEKAPYLTLFAGEKYFSLMYNVNNKPTDYKRFSITNLNDVISITSEYFLKSIAKSEDDIAKLIIAGESIPDEFIKKFEKHTKFIITKINPFDKVLHNPRLIQSKNLTIRNNTFSHVAALSYRLV